MKKGDPLVWFVEPSGLTAGIVVDVGLHREGGIMEVSLVATCLFPEDEQWLDLDKLRLAYYNVVYPNQQITVLQSEGSLFSELLIQSQFSYASASFWQMRKKNVLPLSRLEPALKSFHKKVKKQVVKED